MKAEQAEFRSLVDDAYSGKIRLPEFQRKWVWKRLDVLRLFDSVRKNYQSVDFDFCPNTKFVSIFKCTFARLLVVLLMHESQA